LNDRKIEDITTVDIPIGNVFDGPKKGRTLYSLRSKKREVELGVSTTNNAKQNAILTKLRSEVGGGWGVEVKGGDGPKERKNTCSQWPFRLNKERKTKKKSLLGGWSNEGSEVENGVLKKNWLCYPKKGGGKRKKGWKKENLTGLV